MIDFSKVPERLGERGVWVKPTVTDAQLAMLHRDLQRRLGTPVKCHSWGPVQVRRSVELTEKALRSLQRQQLGAVVIDPESGAENDPQAVHSREGTTGL